jgi:cellulose synthase/poly-beta-1,6-N-acetylglucosamine synthase-like glycosyltransferase
MVIASIIIVFAYLFLIMSFVYGFDKVETYVGKQQKLETKFSVIIPFRNETENLSKLLQSFLSLNYPKNLFEIIFVDDDSQDDSLLIIESFQLKHNFDNIKIIQNNRQTNSPKKDAISTAIKLAKYNWIITTDADCELPINWLSNFNDFILEKSPKMIIASVNYLQPKSLLEGFQLMDFWSLQTATIGGFGIGKPFMCNGANLAYKKSIFIELNGFEGNDYIASGDDLFLMEKLQALEPNSIYYLKSKNSVVYTNAQKSWKLLFQQRLRWAAKSSAYKNIFSKIVGLIILLMNALVVIGLTFTLIGQLNYKYLLLLFIIKFIIDLVAINKSATFFNQKKLLKYYVFSSFTYPFFTISVVMYSLFFKYKWKGRSFKK